MAAFQRYIGIDYSGAKTPTSSLKGLRVYVAPEKALPTAQLPHHQSAILLDAPRSR